MPIRKNVASHGNGAINSPKKNTAMTAPTQRFSDRVQNYIRYRPDYPQAVLESLREEGLLTPRTVVADIGAGTGILTRMLAPHVAKINAVEPNDAMRAAAVSADTGDTNVTYLAATAEATSLPDRSVDLITAGQAFHWFEPTATRAEFTRILRPHGRIALIWNERETDTTPFLAAYETLLRSLSTDYIRVDHTRVDAAAVAAFFASGSYRLLTFPHRQIFDLDGLIGRALSSSYVPNAGEPGHAAFEAELRRIFAQHATDGHVAFLYQTRLYLGQ